MELDKIRFIGRHILKDNKPYFSYSGCGFSFNIQPKVKDFSFTLYLTSELRECDCHYIAIYINDIFHKKEKLINRGNKIHISLTNNKEEINIKVIKLNETYNSSIYLDDIILNNAIFLDVKPSLYPWNKSNLIMVYDPMNVLLHVVC